VQDKGPFKSWHHRHEFISETRGSIDGTLVRDSDHAEAVIREMLARPHVALVHLRNVGYGCYNFAVRRG